MRLGCAGSSFEFDNHPREEYFQEPSTWHGAAAVRLPAARDKRPLSLVLKDLEAPEVDIINAISEGQEEREAKRARGESARGQAFLCSWGEDLTF